MSNLSDAITISFIAMSVIFLILMTLILVIKLLVRWWPHEAPPVLPEATVPQEALPNPEHIAAVHAALAQYMGKSPEEIQLQNVKSP